MRSSDNQTMLYWDSRWLEMLSSFNITLEDQDRFMDATRHLSSWSWLRLMRSSPTPDCQLWTWNYGLVIFFGRNIILMVTVGKEAWQRKNDEEVETIKIKEQGEWINTFEEGIKRKRVNGNEGQNLKTLIQRVLHYLKGKLKQKNQFPVWRQSLVNPEVTQHFITWFV